MKSLVCTFFCLLMASFAWSATTTWKSVDWKINFTQGGELDKAWGNAMAYSYLLCTPTISDPAMSVSDFIENWSPSFVSTETEIACDAPFELGSIDSNTGSVNFEQTGVFPAPGYLVVILVNGNGDIMYSFYGDGTATSALTGEFPIRDQLTPWGTAGSVVFDDSSNWVVVPKGVPELNSVLVLIAIGCFGLVWRRNVRV